MPKRIIIGLFVLSAAALLWTDAHAGCAVIPQPNGSRICASWITGGSEVGLVTFEGLTPAESPPPACLAFPGGGLPPDEDGSGGSIGLTVSVAQSAFPVELKLVGTLPTVLNPGTCGLRNADNQLCDIKGVVFCGGPTTTGGRPGKHDDDDDDDDNDKDKDRHRSSGRRATTKGPLLVEAAGLSQIDPTARGNLGRGFAGFRFQLSPAEQHRLCPGPTSDPDPLATTFRTFVAEEGFFQARVNEICLRERCSVNVNGLDPDDPRIYSCRRIPNQLEAVCN